MPLSNKRALDANIVGAVAHVEVYRREARGAFQTPNVDVAPYQADIYLEDGTDHHGLGKTPSEALLLATTHWHAYANAS